MLCVICTVPVCMLSVGCFFTTAMLIYKCDVFYQPNICYECDDVQEYSEQTDRDYRDHPAVIPLGAYL